MPITWLPTGTLGPSKIHNVKAIKAYVVSGRSDDDPKGDGSKKSNVNDMPSKEWFTRAPGFSASKAFCSNLSEF